MAGRDYQPGREEFIRLICKNSQFERRSQVLLLEEAVNRVTAAELFSAYDLPNAPSSRMDGIALRYDQLMAEKDKLDGWRCGVEYRYSNTGVAVAEGYDTVVVIEDVEVKEDGGISLRELPEKKGENIRPVGSSLVKGELLFSAYTKITPSVQGMLAAGGVRRLAVLDKPEVAIIPTGDELVPPAIPLPIGKTTETNGLVLKAKVEEWGGKAVLYPVIPDDPRRITAVLRQACEQSDIIILMAGSSKGDHDFAIPALEQIGQVLVYEVGHGPAKHTSFTLAANGKPVLGVVGPPGGAELTMDWYVKPLIYQYLCQPVPEPVVVKACLTGPLGAHVPFSFYGTVKLEKGAEGYDATPLNVFAHSRARMAREGGGIVHIPGGRVFQAGEEVDVELKIPLEQIPAKSS